MLNALTGDEEARTRDERRGAMTSGEHFDVMVRTLNHHVDRLVARVTRRGGVEHSRRHGYTSVSPPDVSETFCLPAETKGIMARNFLPMSSIGCFLPVSRSSR